MLSSRFHDLYRELVVELDRHTGARDRNDVSAAFSSRSRLHDLRQQLAIERTDPTV